MALKACWIEIVASTENDDSYSWEVPNNPSDECLVRISDVDGGPSDVSDAVFTITPPICQSDFEPDGDVGGLPSVYVTLMAITMLTDLILLSLPLILAGLIAHKDKDRNE